MGTSSCSATINNLDPFTPYIIEVSCSTGAGEGPRTDSTHVNTTIGSECVKCCIVSDDTLYVYATTCIVLYQEDQ